MQVEFYQNSRGDYPVKEFLRDDKLSDKDKKKVAKFLLRVENENDDKLIRFFRSKNATPFKGWQNLYEFRPFPFRIFFSLYKNICWLLHIIIKRNEGPTPLREIKKAALGRDEILKNK